jgi:hypothetical protein
MRRIISVLARANSEGETGVFCMSRRSRSIIPRAFETFGGSQA